MSSSKFRIPKKTPTPIGTTRGAAEISEESVQKRGPPKRIAHSRRRTSPSAPSVGNTRLTLAEKEAATILTGDVDLRYLRCSQVITYTCSPSEITRRNAIDAYVFFRLLEPRAKRRKEECVSLTFPASKEDTDLRIKFVQFDNLHHTNIHEIHDMQRDLQFFKKISKLKNRNGISVYHI